MHVELHATPPSLLEVKGGGGHRGSHIPSQPPLERGGAGLVGVKRRCLTCEMHLSLAWRAGMVWRLVAKAWTSAFCS